jgi:hypothetical protein
VKFSIVFQNKLGPTIGRFLEHFSTFFPPKKTFLVTLALTERFERATSCASARDFNAYLAIGRILQRKAAKTTFFKLSIFLTQEAKEIAEGHS